MQEPITQEQLVREWLRILVLRLQKQIDKRHIGQTAQLWESFVTNIVNSSNGNVKRAELLFLYYGRFVDMGVGRGVSLTDARENHSQRSRANKVLEGRKPKVWYSKTMTAELGTLADLLAKNFGLEGVSIVEKHINKIQINVKL